ncbi:MAG: hypothetical protein Q8P67_26945, partial [archaeon]|nr:hypothetical protein [archaeon]
MSKDKRLTATLLVRLDSSSFQQPPDARKAGGSLPDPQCLLLSWKRGSKKLNQGLAELISPVAISLNCNFFEKSPPKSTTGSAAAAVCYHPKKLLLALVENSAAPAGDAKKGRSRAKKGRMVGSSTVDLAEWAASPGRSAKRVLFSNGLLCDLLVEVTWTHYHGKRLVSQADGPAPACKSTLTVGGQEFGLMTEGGGSHGEGSDPDTTANFSSDEDRDLDGGFGDKPPGSNSPDSRSESRSTSERESRKARKREPSGAVRRSVSRSSFGTKPNLEAQINVDFVGLEGKNAQSCLSLSWKRGDKKSNCGSKPLPSTPGRTEGFVVVSKFAEKAPSKPDSAIAGESQARSFRPKGLDLSLLQLAEDAAAKKSKPAVIGTQVVDLSEWVASPGESQQRIVFSNGAVLRAVVTVTWKKYNGKKVVPASAAGPSSAQPGAFKSTIAVGSDEFGLVTETDNLSDGDDSELDSAFDDDEPNDDLSRSQSSLGGPSSSSRGARSSRS